MMTARKLIYEQEDKAISLIREHYAQATMVHRQWVEAEKKLRLIGMGLGPQEKEAQLNVHLLDKRIRIKYCSSLLDEAI